MFGILKRAVHEGVTVQVPLPGNDGAIGVGGRISELDCLANDGDGWRSTERGRRHDTGVRRCQVAVVVLAVEQHFEYTGIHVGISVVTVDVLMPQVAVRVRQQNDDGPAEAR